ncbi:MAG: enolase C-terminal domain-like protein, partial [Methanobacteriota archaeon]
VHRRVAELLKAKLPGTAIGKGDEGAWVAPIDDEDALELVRHAADEVGDEVGFEVRVALDVAATELWDGSRYVYRNAKRSPAEQIDFITGLVRDHRLLSVEDPLEENDFDGFATLVSRVGDDVLVVGDDLFVTNPDRVLEGIGKGAANAVLVKPNQCGTLTTTVDTIRLAHDAGYKTVVSHRSGETTDDSIAHIGVAFGCYGIKTGAVGGERIAKLNELIRIEEEL